MKLPVSLTVTFCAAVVLWAATILAYALGQHIGVTVAAFVLGCLVAWAGIVWHLD